MHADAILSAHEQLQREPWGDAFDALIAAIEEAGRRRDRGAIPLLVELLGDPHVRPGPLGSSRSVRLAAERALIDLGPLALPALREALIAKTEILGRSIVHLLRQVEDPASDEALIAALSLHDAHPSIRWGAAGILGNRRSRGAVEALIACLADREPFVVRSAAHALGQIGDPRAIAHLEALDGDEGVREARQIALGMLGLVSQRQPLLALLTSTPDGSTVSACAEALLRLGEEALEAMIGLLDDGGNPRIEQPLASALHDHPDPRAVDALARWRRRLDRRQAAPRRAGSPARSGVGGHVGLEEEVADRGLPE